MKDLENGTFHLKLEILQWSGVQLFERLGIMEDQLREIKPTIHQCNMVPRGLTEGLHYAEKRNIIGKPTEEKIQCQPIFDIRNLSQFLLHTEVGQSSKMYFGK